MSEQEAAPRALPPSLREARPARPAASPPARARPSPSGRHNIVVNFYWTAPEGGRGLGRGPSSHWLKPSSDSAGSPRPQPGRNGERREKRGKARGWRRVRRRKANLLRSPVPLACSGTHVGNEAASAQDAGEALSTRRRARE